MNYPTTVSTIEEIIDNIQRFESYLSATASQDDYDTAVDLIRRGINLIAYNVGTEIHFIPSRFVGYKDNNLITHSFGKEKQIVSGSETSPRIDKILGPRIPNRFDNEFRSYCSSLGVSANKDARKKYWTINLNYDDACFLEGKRQLRLHYVKERNQKVVELAKLRYKEENGGRLICSACKIDMGIVYGKAGEGYIEAHHNVPLSKLNGEHEVKITDFIMLCPNCHKMHHKAMEKGVKFIYNSKK